jgi:hypothetical protein
MLQEVFVLSEKFEDDLWTFYIVRPSRREILVATGEAYLKDVLTRLEALKKGGNRPIDALAGFPGWKHVDTTAPFWAVRRYDASAASDDPSSPIGLHGSAPIKDHSAIGLTISYFSNKPARIQVCYLTRATDGSTQAAELWRAWRLEPKELASNIQEIEPGVIRLDVDQRRMSPREWLLCISWLRGHLVFV